MRVSDERLSAKLSRMPKEGSQMEFGEAENWRAMLDLRDARQEIARIKLRLEKAEAAIKALRTHETFCPECDVHLAAYDAAKEEG